MAAFTAAMYLSLAHSSYSNSTADFMCNDKAYAVETIVQGEVDALIIDEAYLLVYTVCSPWYSKSRNILNECLVLRIGEGSTFSAVTQVLEDLGDEYDVDAIVTGGALARNSKAIVRLYERAGYTLETHTPQLTKRRR